MPIHTPLIALSIGIGAVACGSDRPPADVSQPADTSWVVSTKAFGPLQIGMTRAQAEAVVGAPLSIAGDSDWKSCGYLQSTYLPPGTRVMVEGGTIARVDVDSGTVATADGAKVGDSEDRIRQLYPTAASTPHKYTRGHDLTVTRDSSAIVFETDGSRVTRYRAGRLPPVGYVEGCG